MELKLLNDKGQSTATVAAPDTLFGRDYNEALVHQIVVAYQANARQGHPRPEGRGEAVKHSTKKPWRQKGTGRARAGMTSSPLWRGGGRTFPNLPGRELQPQGQPEDVSRGHGVDPVAARARGPPRRGRRPCRRRAQDQVAGRQAQGDGTGRVGADHHRRVDENLYLSSRNLPERDGGRAALRRSGVADLFQEDPRHQARRSRNSRRCWA